MSVSSRCTLRSFFGLGPAPVAIDRGSQLVQILLIVFERARLAQEAGADFVGLDDLIAKIQGGWVEFDVAIVGFLANAGELIVESLAGQIQRNGTSWGR